MKIVHIFFDFLLGGAENMLVDIINEQIKKENISLIIVNNEFNSILLKEIDNRVRINIINRKPGQ